MTIGTTLARWGAVAAVAVVMLAAGAAQSAGADLPPDREYVTVQDGHLSLDGQRVRFWAVIGGFPNGTGIEPGDNAPQRQAKIARSRADTEAIVQRFIDLGFNMSRFWRNSEKDYVKGDGSREDVVDHFIYTMKQRGLKIWYPSISAVVAKSTDVGILDEPATAEAWKSAMEEVEKNNLGMISVARVWDERLEAFQKAAIVRRATHLNHWTGLRCCDDPVYAVWELTNEEWWMSKMVGGVWKKLPAFFQDSLKARWHEFLRAKYGRDDKLIARWGFLLPGESLQKGNIAILPLRGGVKLDAVGMDSTALEQMKAAYGEGKQDWTRDDFNAHRGEDVLEFFMTIQLAHKKRLGDLVKSLGKSTRLAPIVYDTGIGYEIQSQYLHQNAEAVSHDAYVDGSPRNKLNQRFPWFSGLEEWPRICLDMPWLEHNRVEGKPFLCYETQIQQPAKYRVEFPLRILALAAIQDWDAVCWHYWGSAGDITTRERPFDKALDYTVSRHPQGYHYTYDEVQNSVMRAAGLAFRNGAIAPAASPTTFIYGRKSLYNPDSMDYAGSYGKVGYNMLPTTYQYGVRIQIDPTREDDEVKGPMVQYSHEGRHTIIRPHDQIEFDVARGGLTLDSPAAAGFTGFLSRFGESLRFRNGVTLSKVEIRVPADMPYGQGLAEEKYIAFVLVSDDGLPLDKTRRATLSLVSTSFNSGFVFGEALRDGKTKPGKAPVLVARVGATVDSAALTGMRYVLRDWHMKEIASGVVAEGRLTVPADKPVFIVELTRP